MTLKSHVYDNIDQMVFIILFTEYNRCQMKMNADIALNITEKEYMSHKYSMVSQTY